MVNACPAAVVIKSLTLPPPHLLDNLCQIPVVHFSMQPNPVIFRVITHSNKLPAFLKQGLVHRNFNDSINVSVIVTIAILPCIRSLADLRGFPSLKR